MYFSFFTHVFLDNFETKARLTKISKIQVQLNLRQDKICFHARTINSKCTSKTKYYKERL
jgi:hypothetical protein